MDTQVIPLKRSKYLEPEETGVALWDSYGKKVYRFCQKMKIPTISLCQNISRDFPFPCNYVDELALSNHIVGIKVQQNEEMNINSQWELAKLKQEPCLFDNRRRKVHDSKSFCKYSLGNQTPINGHGNVWSLVKSIDLELTLGLMCSLPQYREAHFKWETHLVNGTHHSVCRHNCSSSGMIKTDGLANEIHMLIGFTFRTALLNTSC